MPYINLVLWQHVVCVNGTPLRVRLTVCVCRVVCSLRRRTIYTIRHAATTPN